MLQWGAWISMCRALGCRTRAAHRACRARGRRRVPQPARAVEPELIATCELPPSIASVSVSVDRVTVPMEERAGLRNQKALGGPCGYVSSATQVRARDLAAHRSRAARSRASRKRLRSDYPAQLPDGVLRHGDHAQPRWRSAAHDPLRPHARGGRWPQAADAPRCPSHDAASSG